VFSVMRPSQVIKRYDCNVYVLYSGVIMPIHGYKLGWGYDGLCCNTKVNCPPVITCSIAGQAAGLDWMSKLLDFRTGTQICIGVVQPPMGMQIWIQVYPSVAGLIKEPIRISYQVRTIIELISVSNIYYYKERCYKVHKARPSPDKAL